MTTAEKVNNSAVLGALAKVGMMLAPIVVSIGLFIIGSWLDSYGKAMGAFDGRLANSEQAASLISSRLSNLDTRITVTESRLETQSRDMDKVVDGLDEVSKSLQGMALVVETTKTDVGYLRREEEKRKAVRE